MWPESGFKTERFSSFDTSGLIHVTNMHDHKRVISVLSSFVISLNTTRRDAWRSQGEN